MSLTWCDITLVCRLRSGLLLQTCSCSVYQRQRCEYASEPIYQMEVTPWILFIQVPVSITTLSKSEDEGPLYSHFYRNLWINLIQWYSWQINATLTFTMNFVNGNACNGTDYHNLTLYICSQIVWKCMGRGLLIIRSISFDSLSSLFLQFCLAHFNFHPTFHSIYLFPSPVSPSFS